MIAKRSTKEELTKETILSKVSDVDIFAHYCLNFKRLDDKFNSEFRNDKRPSCSITIWNGKAYYRDFAYDEHRFDCFSYVMFKMNCGFFDALRIIDRDFNLKLSAFPITGTFTPGSASGIKRSIKRSRVIRIRSRKWNAKDAEFWSQYKIKKKTLIHFNVLPIDYYWLNEYRFSCEQSYAFKLGSKYKIYSPLAESEYKWVTNATSKNIQGYKQLPESGEICVLTSSLKDVMCLYEIGIPAVALQSEMQMPDSKFIEHLKLRFDKLILFYDNDFTNPDNPGQTMAKSIQEVYSCLENVYLPSEYQVKDPSDYVKKYQSFELIKSLVHEKTKN